jgi:hypothetical protein
LHSVGAPLSHSIFSHPKIAIVTSALQSVPFPSDGIEPRIPQAKLVGATEAVALQFSTLLKSVLFDPDHFADIVKMVDLGSGGTREFDDLMLTRFACYLTTQNERNTDLERACDEQSGGAWDVAQSRDRTGSIAGGGGCEKSRTPPHLPREKVSEEPGCAGITGAGASAYQLPPD